MSFFLARRRVFSGLKGVKVVQMVIPSRWNSCHDDMKSDLFCQTHGYRRNFFYHGTELYIIVIPLKTLDIVFLLPLALQPVPN